MTLKDLKDVLEILAPICPKWNGIGIALRVEKPSLDRIRVQFTDPGDALAEVISKWLSGIDPEPTWAGLAEGLRSAIVGDHRLAAEVVRKYCSQTQQQINVRVCYNNILTLML